MKNLLIVACIVICALVLSGCAIKSAGEKYKALINEKNVPEKFVNAGENLDFLSRVQGKYYGVVNKYNSKHAICIKIKDNRISITHVVDRPSQYGGKIAYSIIDFKVDANTCMVSWGRNNLIFNSDGGATFSHNNGREIVRATMNRIS